MMKSPLKPTLPSETAVASGRDPYITAATALVVPLNIRALADGPIGGAKKFLIGQLLL